jgi:hypothetical protein
MTDKKTETVEAIEPEAAPEAAPRYALFAVRQPTGIGFAILEVPADKKPEDVGQGALVAVVSGHKEHCEMLCNMLAESFSMGFQLGHNEGMKTNRKDRRASTKEGGLIMLPEHLKPVDR